MAIYLLISDFPLPVSHFPLGVRNVKCEVGCGNLSNCQHFRVRSGMDGQNLDVRHKREFSFLKVYPQGSVSRLTAERRPGVLVPVVVSSRLGVVR